MPSKIRILFLAAQPAGHDPLRLGEEARDIEQKLRAAPKGRSFELISQWAVRPRDLMETLMIYQPTIVHFSGHGVEGKLILEDNNGGMQRIEGKQLADLLVGFSSTIRLVVLNACFTLSGFTELGRVIDYTVGTTSALDDSAAVRFSSCFYQALAFGYSVQAAYELSKRQINLEDPDSSDAFTLLIREGVNAVEPFVKPRHSRSAQATHSTDNNSRGKSEEARSDSFFQNSAAPTVDRVAVNQVTDTLGGSWRSGNLQGENSLYRVPAEIKESLERFRADYPDARKVAFLMMRFGKTKTHENIVAAIRKSLDSLGVAVVRADDKQYHDDLFPNVLTYVYGCGFGIAVFERIETEEFNPNVALEVGYMFALGRQVCLLKDRTLTTLHADLVGKLYRVFDPLDPLATIPQELSRWLRDKGLQEDA